MGAILLRKIFFLFLLISASLLSTSCAGRPSSFISKLLEEEGAMTTNLEEAITMSEEAQVYHHHDQEIHERILRANTKDYGRYDPAPALVKPPFKLIPN